MTKKPLSKLGLLMLSLIIISCFSDVDFEQADTISISPIVTSSIFFIEEPANRFVEEGNEITTIKDSISNIEILRSKFVVDNLIKAEFLFEATNSIHRAFKVRIDFYSEAFALNDTYIFTIEESPENKEQISEHIKLFEANNLAALTNTTQIVVTLTLLPSNEGILINETTLGKVQLRLKGTFYLNIETAL